jgi:hypothetical protein
MDKAMKNLIRTIFDRLTLRLMRWPLVERFVGFLAYQRRRVIRSRLERQLRDQGTYGDTVMQGPFRGLTYPPLEHWASCRFEKIVGTYEHELHALIDRLPASKSYQTIVNVGGAEGFYSIGLALLFPAARVFSFEAQPFNTDFGKNLACLNGVEDRIDFQGFCTAETLAAVQPKGPVLVWMDIDTGERPVLDPVKVPWLLQADILVELHDCLEPGLTPLIRSRFSTTHHIQQITNSGVEYVRYPILRDLPFFEIDALVGDDRRGLQDWLFMEPHP